jgi:hypothetical protein
VPVALSVCREVYIANFRLGTVSLCGDKELMANKTFCGLKMQRSSENLKRQTKCMLYRTLIRPILTYGSDCWLLSKGDGIMLWVFETRMLRMMWVQLTIMKYGEQDRIKSFIPFSMNRNVVQIGRLRGLGHFCRMQ